MLAMDTIAKRARAARQFAGLTQKEAEAASGVKQSDISKIERGDTERSTGLIALARAYGVDPTWLDLGDGSTDGGVVLANGVRADLASGRRSPPNVEPGPNPRGLVPLISWVQAGSWCEAADPFQPGDAERWMPCPVAHGPHSYALRVRGDSMTAPHGNSRTYPEGCIVYVDPDRGSPVNGDRVVAKLRGTEEVTFKVYKEEDGRRWLMPLNPAHLPIRDEFTVCGIIIGKWEDG